MTSGMKGSDEVKSGKTPTDAERTPEPSTQPRTEEQIRREDRRLAEQSPPLDPGQDLAVRDVKAVETEAGTGLYLVNHDTKPYRVVRQTWHETTLPHQWSDVGRVDLGPKDSMQIDVDINHRIIIDMP